jgi:hypothetical protein
MQIKTLGAVAGATFSIGAGAAIAIWPGQVIPWVVLAGSSVVLVGCVLWWFFANYRLVLPFVPRPANDPPTALVSESGALRVPARRPLPEPDTWFREAIVYVVHGRWLGEREQALTTKEQKERAADLFDEFRQLGRNDRLTVFGKLWENSTWDPIAPDYWAHHEVPPLELFRDEHPEHSCTVAATPSGTGPFYRSLRVSKSQCEELWPAVT